MNLTMERLFLEDESGNVLVINSNGSLNVEASNLDIRDLTHVSDSVKIGDGTDLLAVNADGSINAVVSATDLDIRPLTNADVVTAEQGTSPWVVSASDLDIRDLAYGTDSVTAYQGGSWAMSLAAPNGALATAAKALTDVAAALVASPLANRKQIIIQNKGNQSIFLGGSSVSDANGIEVAKGSSFATESGPAQAWYAVCASGKTSSAHILEQA